MIINQTVTVLGRLNMLSSWPLFRSLAPLDPFAQSELEHQLPELHGETQHGRSLYFHTSASSFFSSFQLHKIFFTKWRSPLPSIPSLHRSLLFLWRTPDKSPSLGQFSTICLRPRDCLGKSLSVEIPEWPNREESRLERSWQKKGKEKKLCDS